MIGFSWSQLGAFSANSFNISPTQISLFAAAGGRWVVPVLYNDDDSAAKNLAILPQLQQTLASHGVRTGCWANCFGEDPDQIMADVKVIVSKYNLSPVVFDAEIAYQGNTKMASLAASARKFFPLGSKALGVSTNAPNDSSVYNGRTGGYPAPLAESFRAKNIHLLPQWYSSPRYWGPWTHADQTMQWVDAHGMEDNWLDAAFMDKRAIRKNMIHGTLEVTGLEGASLKTSLDECVVARKQYGLGKGISLYMLENTPDSDFALVKAQQGYLYS